MNIYVACEPEFYDHHPIDKHWSQTIEQVWPSVRAALKNRAIRGTELDHLFSFVAAQKLRTHSYMNVVAHELALRAAKKKRVVLEGREGTGVFLNMVDTGEVMDFIQAVWPKAREALETDYVWTVYHNSFQRLFLTGDDPCQWNPANEAITMPIALDMALLGRVIKDGEQPDLRHASATAELVTRVNREIVRGCHSFVYAHEETEELGRFVKKNYVQPDVMFGGRSFTNDPKPPMSDEEIALFVKRFEEMRKRDRDRNP